MRQFLDNFAELYPCSYCAEDMRKFMKENPPDVHNGKTLSMWMCKMHNDVNRYAICLDHHFTLYSRCRRTGKPEFDCAKYFERWRDGPSDGSCG